MLYGLAGQALHLSYPALHFQHPLAASHLHHFSNIHPDTIIPIGKTSYKFNLVVLSHNHCACSSNK